MGIRFLETMRGTVTREAREQAFEFTVSVRGDSFVGAWGRSPLDLSGSVRLEGVGDDIPVAPGSYLEIGLPFRRELVYCVLFEADGHRFRFRGNKTIRYLRFPWTIRRLDGHLYRDGEDYGRARLFFPFRTLPSFLASFRVGPFA